MAPLLVDMEVVIATKDQLGVVQEAYVNIIVIITLPVADMMTVTISNAITTMSIGMILIVIGRINMTSVALIIVIPGNLIIVPEAMFTKKEFVMIRVALEALVTAIAKQTRI